MSELKQPLKVFLCHASTDKPKVRELYKRLIDDGVEVWFDVESLIAGQNWQIEIPKAIRSSDAVIVCLSKNSITKEGYVQKEIKYALDIADEKPEGTIFIIPVRLEECQVPNRLNLYHWVDIFDEGYIKLLKALKLRSAQLGRIMTAIVDFSFSKSEMKDVGISERKIDMDKDYLLRKVKEELESEGENPQIIVEKSEEVLRFIVTKIAKRLRRSVDDIWDALVRLGGG